jgi:histidine ammonia-lyase
MAATLTLDGRSLGWEEIARVLEGPVRVRLSPASLSRVKASRAAVERAIERGDKVYGVTTGFGKLADRLIDRQDALALQRNLILSHAVGTGPALPAPETRLMMLFRVNGLARGNSGCTPDMIEFIARLIERDALPEVPEQGSVGASGDLAPLAHLGILMLGETEGARAALRRAGLKRYRFQEKEGLCLVNGTQFTLALLASAALQADGLARAADAVGAMTLEGLMGSVRPFDARLHEARPHRGQALVAKNLRRLLRDSRIVEAHAQCLRIQDGYSLRCIPQVHGAAREVLEWTRGIVLTEANSSSDNPLVFDSDGAILSGGNFHGMLLAHAADALTAAVTTLGNISERRIESLTNPDISGLPAFLSHEGGLNSGFMMLQVEAAALAAENRTLCYPACVANIPTSAGKEDMVSMSPIAARHLREAVANVRTILAIEAMCAAQALDFRRPLQPGAGARAGHRSVRRVVAHCERDRYLKPDLEALRGHLAAGRFLADVEREAGRLA